MSEAAPGRYLHVGEESAEAPPAPGFRERFLGMILRPRATIAGLTERDAWILPAVLYLIGYLLYYLALGWGSARWQAIWMQQMMVSSGRATSGQGAAAQFLNTWLAIAPTFQLFGTVLQVPLTVALSWGIRTALFYGLARLLGGDRPPLRRVIAMVGWAWVPLFLQYTLIGAGMLAIPAVMHFFLPLPTDPAEIQTGEMMRKNWQGQFLILVSPFVAWNLVLCWIGVRDLFRLPGWKAALVVLLPTVGHLIFQLAGYLLSLAMLDSMPQLPAPTPNGPAPGPTGP